MIEIRRSIPFLISRPIDVGKNAPQKVPSPEERNIIFRAELGLEPRTPEFELLNKVVPTAAMLKNGIVTHNEPPAQYPTVPIIVSTQPRRSVLCGETRKSVRT